MYYAKLRDGVPVRCNISDEVPDITFTAEPTAEQLAPYDVVIVNDATSLPEFNAETHGLAETTPHFIDGKWYANYDVIELAPVETPPQP
jgi:hypothetical protein